METKNNIKEEFNKEDFENIQGGAQDTDQIDTEEVGAGRIFGKTLTGKTISLE